MAYGDASDLAAELSAVAARLKAAADGGLRKELGNAIDRAAVPVTAEIRSGLPGYMPDRYAGVLDGDLRLSVYKFLSRAEPGVTILASTRSRRRKIRQVNAGLLRHPLFGNREFWYQQGPLGGGMKPGWFDEPASRSAPQFRKSIEAALEDVALKLAGKG